MSVPPKRRPLRRRIKKFFSKRLAALAAAILPLPYVFYMNLVWRTSRIEAIGVEAMVEARRRSEGLIAVLWHENVFFVAYAFRELRASTLASTSEFGQLITNMLHRCGFVVFRGGSTRGKEQASRILYEMVDHMRRRRFVMFGITVDGSRGPRHVLKPGALSISRACQVPIVRMHIACRPSLTAPSWDRTRIPLPFSRIVILFEGCWTCPPRVKGDEFEALRAGLEADLARTALRAEEYLAAGCEGVADRRNGPRLLVPGESLGPMRRDG